MQRTWRHDRDKCTFIVIDRTAAAAGEEERPSPLGRAVGDVNLFFNDSEDPKAAEIEVMVAVAASRRKGVAGAALRVLMQWARQELSVTRFVAKIGHANVASTALFSQRLGYSLVRRCDVFEETTFELAAEALREEDRVPYGVEPDAPPVTIDSVPESVCLVALKFVASPLTPLARARRSALRP